MAAIFSLGFVASLEAEPASSGKTASKTNVTKPAASRKSAVSGKKTRTSGKRSEARRSRSANRSEAVDRVAVETPEPFGPFLPLEVADYPRPLCEPTDVVLEAHVHESDAETPESESAADDMPEAEENPLLRAARSFGSLLRPKSPESTMRPEDVDLSELLSAGVQIPVEGVDSSRLKDSFLNSRGRHRKHLAIDIGAPKGTPVVAAADGEIVMLRRENRGGISLYQKDKSGKYMLYYCHLSRYAKGLKPGDKVSKGDVIAKVGATGHVIGGAHLHFSITRVPEDAETLRGGVAINPYLLFLAAVQ